MRLCKKAVSAAQHETLIKDDNTYAIWRLCVCLGKEYLSFLKNRRTGKYVKHNITLLHELVTKVPDQTTSWTVVSLLFQIQECLL
jgi:hypothetical protein